MNAIVVSMLNATPERKRTPWLGRWLSIFAGLVASGFVLLLIAALVVP